MLTCCKALNCGIVQQLYGNCRVGVEKRWTWETACWQVSSMDCGILCYYLVLLQPMETQLSLQFLGDTYAIATSYKMEQGTAKFSCRWLW